MRGAIDSVHARLQQEIGSLRNLMSHLNRARHGSRSVTERLTEMLARFQVETNIRARLLSSAALAARRVSGRSWCGSSKPPCPTSAGTVARRRWM
jgi:hypothetical protein